MANGCLVAVCGVFLFAAAACGAPARSPGAGRSGTGSVAQGRADADAAALAGRLRAPKSEQDGAQAAMQAFAWAGMATYSWKEEIQPASAPAAPIVTPDFFAVHLARDYANAAGARRVSLESVGQALGRLGWAPTGKSPGEALAAVLAQMIAEARAHPDAPESFTPLFIGDSQKTALGIDVSQPDTPPTEILLSLLELRMFLAAHLRGAERLPSKASGLEPGQPASTRLAKTVPVLASPTPGQAPPSICARVLEREDMLGQLTRGRLTMGSSIAMGLIYKRLGIGGGPASLIYTYLRILDWLFTLRDNSVRFVLISDDSKTHKPTGATERSARFNAKVSVWQEAGEFEKLARDCGKALGFDVSASLDFSKWRIFWDEPRQSGELISIPDRNDFDFANPRPGHKVRVDGPHNGHAELVVDVVREEQHRPDAERESSKAWMRAELNEVEPPDLATLMSPLTLAGELSPLGLAQELVGIAEAIWGELNPKVAEAFVTVEWCPSQIQEWVGSIEYRGETKRQSTDAPTTAANGTQSGSREETTIQTATVKVDGRKSTGSVSLSQTVRIKTDRTWIQQCEFKKHAFQKKFEQHGDSLTSSSARASGPVEAGATVSPDGSYVVSFATPHELWGTLRIEVKETQIGCQGRGDIPHPTHEERWNPGGFSDSASGTDYSGSGALSGSKTERSPDGATTVTMKWSLTPKPKR